MNLASQQQRETSEAFPKALRVILSPEPEARHLPLPINGTVPSHPAAERRITIWIDLENTPHVPFFNPIVNELRSRGYHVVLSAREAFQTCEMAVRYGFEFTKIGRHYGQRKLYKIWGLIARSLQLLPFVSRERPHLGLNHGSRSQLLICNLLHIPTVMIMDYEHVTMPPLVRPRWEIVPEAVAKADAHCRESARLRTFSGIKEDVYVPDFTPDSSIVQQLGLDKGIVVTVRPPATEALYHCAESEILFVRFMERACRTQDVRIVLLPRNEAQKRQLTTRHGDWFKGSSVIIPNAVVDGLNLLWHSDLAVSGGGTMNREAAALGVPVYSVFRGKLGAVDRKLEQDERLTMIRSIEDVETKIVLQRRDKNRPLHEHNRRSLQDIVAHLEDILRIEYKPTFAKATAAPRKYILRLPDPRVRGNTM